MVLVTQDLLGSPKGLGREARPHCEKPCHAEGFELDPWVVPAIPTFGDPVYISEMASLTQKWHLHGSFFARHSHTICHLVRKGCTPIQKEDDLSTHDSHF